MVLSIEVRNEPVIRHSAARRAAGLH